MFPPRPSVPVPYLTGTITVPQNKVSGVLQLIWDQLNERCPGTSVEFRISADPANVSPIFIGSGPDLNCNNYGAQLTPNSGERRYRASYPGTGTPQGVMQVFSEAPANKFHFEVNE